jgi:hypothetical protein
MYTPVIFLGACILVLFTTIFFLLPVLLLGFIQMRNFCINKTTNERFARRANSVVSDRSQSQMSGTRSGSVVSSRLSNDATVEQMLNAENRRCGWLGNCGQMCCNHQMVDQMELFKK